MSFLDPYTLIGTTSLIIQVIVFFLLIFGYQSKRKQKVRRHGIVMASALILHLVAILVIMIPSFVLAVVPEFIIPDPLMMISLVGLIHGITGVLAIILGGYLVAAWRFQLDVSGCFKRKQIMRATITVWFIALVLGVVIYALFYGPLLMVRFQ
jgi:uncharacterized membrane protein YozB (DUF420 family)